MESLRSFEGSYRYTFHPLKGRTLAQTENGELCDQILIGEGALGEHRQMPGEWLLV